LISTPHPGPLLVGRGEGELFCGTISRRRPIASANTGLISVTPSAYLNSRSRGSCISRFTSSGLRPPSPHRMRRRTYLLHFARKTFNPWAGLKTDSQSPARDAGRHVVVPRGRRPTARGGFLTIAQRFNAGIYRVKIQKSPWGRKNCPAVPHGTFTFG
jgi:hypothetical protein